MIDHKFPESGHRFLDSDRDFAKIEQAVRRHQNIFAVDEYHSIMTQSQVKCTPSVTRIGNMMYSVKRLPEMLHLTHRSVNMAGEKVCFRDCVRWIRVTAFGYYHDESAHWSTVKLLKDKTSCDVSRMQLLLRAVNTTVVKRKKWKILKNRCHLFQLATRISTDMLLHNHLPQLMQLMAVLLILTTAMQFQQWI